MFKRCSAVYRKHAVARHSADNVHVAVQHNVAVVDNLAVIAGSVSLSRLAEVVLYTAKGKLSVNCKRYAAVYGNGDVGVNAHVPGNPVFVAQFAVSRRVRCGVGNNQVNSLGNCRVLIEGNVFVQYQVSRYTLVSGSQSLFQSLVEVAVYSCRVGAVWFDDSRVGNVGRNRCNVGFVDGNKFSANAVRPTVEGVTVVYRCRKGVVSSAVRKTVCWYFGVGRYAAALFVAHFGGNGVLLTYKTHVCNGKGVFVGFAVIKGTSRIADVNVVHVAFRNVGIDGNLPTHPAQVAGCFVVKSSAFGCFVLVVTFHQFGAEVSHVGVVSRKAYVGSSRHSREGQKVVVIQKIVVLVQFQRFVVDGKHAEIAVHTVVFTADVVVEEQYAVAMHGKFNCGRRVMHAAVACAVSSPVGAGQTKIVGEGIQCVVFPRDFQRFVGNQTSFHGLFKLDKEGERNVAAAFLAVHNVNFGVVVNVVHQAVEGFLLFLHGQHKFVVDVQFRRFPDVEVGRFQQQTVVRRVGFHSVVGVKFCLFGNHVVALGKFEGEIRKFFVGNYNFRLKNKFDGQRLKNVENVAVGSDEVASVKFVTDVFVAVFCHSPRLNSRAVVDRRSDCAVGKLKNIQYVPVFTVVGYSYVDCFIVVACVNIVDPTGVVVAGVFAVIGDSPNVVAQCFVGFGKGNVIRFANRLSNKGNGAVCIGDIVNVEVSARVVFVDGQFVVQRDVVHVVEVQRKHYGVCIAVAVVACKLTVGKRPCVCGSGSACNGVVHVV